jgi:hypothetical protein
MKFGVPPSGGRIIRRNIPPEGGTPNSTPNFISLKIPKPESPAHD